MKNPIYALFACLFLLLGTVTFAQTTDYNSLWSQYEQADHSYFQDAQKMLDKISGLAFEEHDELQLFRVNYERYMLRSQYGYSSWGTKNHLLYLDGLRKTSPQPYQGLYHYLIANKIISDLDFRNTTPSGKTDLSLYEEWSDAEKRAAAKRYYAEGLSQLLEYGNIPATPFSFLLYAPTESLCWQPVLFDLVLMDILACPYPFLVDSLLDTLLPKAILWHNADNRPQAALFYELQLLNLRHNIESPVTGFWDSIPYWQELERLEREYPYDISLRYQKAAFLYLHHQTHPEFYTPCRQILEELSALPNDKTPIPQNARCLLDKLTEPRVQLVAQNTNRFPRRKIDIPIRYKNIDTLYLSVYKTDNIITSYRNEQKTVSPFSSCFREHFHECVQRQQYRLNPVHSTVASTDLWIDSLPYGKYTVALHNGAVPDSNNCLCVFPMIVSSVQWTQIERPDGITLFASDAQTGKPITHRKTSLNLDFSVSSAVKMSVAIKRRTDKYGRIFIPNARIKGHLREYYDDFLADMNISLPDHNDCYRAEIEIPGGRWHPYRYRYRYSSRRARRFDDDTRHTVQIITDRSLYRPGQTVYFKAIFQKNGKPLKRGRVEVSMERTGKERLETLHLPLSKFGSVSGKFVLPNQPGSYTIRCSKENNWRWYEAEIVTAEEYKLPSYYVKLMDMPENEWHHDSIFVKGSAVSYAGFPLIGADVTLRLRTQTYGRNANVHFYEETLKTDASGCFSFVFPKLDYNGAASTEVEAVLTDVNGETHTAKKSLYIYWKPFQFEIQMQETVNQWLEDTLSAVVISRDILKKRVSVPVKVTALRLRMPERTGVYHPLPQEPLYTEAQYRQYFPEYFYDRRDGDNPTYWDVMDTVWQTTRSFYPDSLLMVDISKWLPGYYRFEYQLEDSLYTAKETRVFRIIHTGKQAIPSQNPLHIEILQSEAKIPDRETRTSVSDYAGNKSLFRKNKIPVIIGSTLENSYVTLCYQTSHNLQKIKKFHLNNNLDTFTLRLRNTGYLKIRAFCYKNSQLFNDSHNYSIGKKLTKRQERFISNLFNNLNVNIIHWNSRVQPGQECKWEVEISDARDRHPNTEVLAWMLDKSLYGLDMTPLEIKQRSNRLEDLTWWQQQWLKLYNRKKFHGSYHGFGLQNTSETVQPTLKPIIECSIEDGPALKMRSVWPKFTPDATSSRGRVSGESIRTTPGRSLTSALSNLEGVSSLNESRTVRGNRSDGTKTVVDGVRVRDGEESVVAEELSNDIEHIVSPARTYIRKNFTETAFFEPALRTDKEGRVRMVFTVPDQFTEWQMNLYGHTRKGLTVFNSLSATSCQSLMIQSNAPRFFREGDTMMFQAKITNITDTLLRGTTRIEFFNPETNDLIPALLGDAPEKEFHCGADKSTNVSWRVAVPRNLSVIAYRITAQSGRYTDGMEAVLPVLSSRTAVTESMHFVVPVGEDTTLIFKRLKDNQSTTLHSNNYTVEITANPSWTAIQSLEYLMTYRYECNEQLFSKLYANALARHIVNQFPQIKDVYAQWASDTTMQGLESQLFKNEQLKSILLSESPWVMDAQRENARMQQMAKLFQTSRLDKEMEAIARKLKNNQMDDGGFAWFGKSFFSPYITNHLVASYAKLQSLGVEIPDMEKVMRKAIQRLDTFQKLKFTEYQKDPFPHKYFHFTEEDIQYLYARTWFGIDSSWLSQAYVQNLLSLLTTDVRNRPLMQQAQTGLVLHRLGRTNEAQRIMERIRQQAITSSEEGMFWGKEYNGRYYRWYQAPIERQAVLIEAFNIISPKKQELDQMKQWLLMQKHQQGWSNTKATAEAIFALMMGDASVLNTESNTTLRIGDARFVPEREATSVPGTGYFTKSWTEGDITPKLAEITVAADTSHFVFGACYWQYVEDIDKVSESATGLRVQRVLYHEVRSPEGLQLVPVTAENPARLGEKLTVRLTITSDRDLEYVHLKDSRAAAFEPVSSHTQYLYRHPLSYTMVPHDAATDFFFDRMPKGTHIIDYPLLATQLGTFLNGLATIECMYAPEFRGHSAPLTVTVVR
ncbi:MAG: hypothetical protein K6F40_04890 [Bacteroidales bacterium]|nr:hypothetical protein [Bacteroidales bacterium]